MKVLHLFPPNYAQINQAFKVRGKPVIFAFGSTIYNPARIKIPPELLVHEGVHQQQQGDDPLSWWDRYIADTDFRLEQEIPAHRAEYGSNPNEQALRRIAERLASPLYGSLVDVATARQMILNNGTRITGD